LSSSLVTTLRAAEQFSQDHLSSPAVAPLIEGAKVFYVEGYFMTHGLKSILEVSEKAANASKVGVILFIMAYSNLQIYCRLLL
jgi:adenosine kinase